MIHFRPTCHAPTTPEVLLSDGQRFALADTCPAELLRPADWAAETFREPHHWRWADLPDPAGMPDQLPDLPSGAAVLVHTGHEWDVGTYRPGTNDEHAYPNGLIMDELHPEAAPLSRDFRYLPLARQGHAIPGRPVTTIDASDEILTTLRLATHVHTALTRTPEDFQTLLRLERPVTLTPMSTLRRVPLLISRSDYGIHLTRGETRRLMLALDVTAALLHGGPLLRVSAATRAAIQAAGPHPDILAATAPSLELATHLRRLLTTAAPSGPVTRFSA